MVQDVLKARARAKTGSDEERDMFMGKAKRVWGALTIASAMMLGSSAANAVASYGDIVTPPGVYFGSGNVNGNWTIDTANNIELAIRAKHRDGSQATIDGSSGVYHANGGTCGGGIGCTGGTKARWNYEFSVNTQAGGGGLFLNGLYVEMAVDTDRTAGENFVLLDVFTNWPDNSYWNGAERTGPFTGGPQAGEYGVQQSVNPLFGNSGFMPGFDPFAPGLYSLRLSAYDGSATGTLLAQTQTIVAVPEPGSLALLGLAFAAVGFGRRRMKAK